MHALQPIPVFFALLCVLLPAPPAAPHELEGLASWYAGKFQGRLTANGEVFDTNELTAAHRTLPFGTIVEVEHLGNRRTVRVRINDRGPFIDGRVIDLSRAAADTIGMTAQGLAAVRLKIVAEAPPERRTIQVGSFRDRSNAERVAARLAAAGIRPSVEEAAGVYRVVVGPVGLEEVAGLTRRLAEIGYTSVLVRAR